MKTFFSLLILLISFTHTFAQESSMEIPEGWRIPNKSDISGNWERFQKEDYIPYHFVYDFDQNGITDEAWILIKNDESSFGVWVLSKTEDSQNNYPIIEFEMPLNKPQSLGISITNTGTFKTACGKEYYDCTTNKPPHIVVTTPQLWF